MKNLLFIIRKIFIIDSLQDNEIFSHRYKQKCQKNNIEESKHIVHLSMGKAYLKIVYDSVKIT